MAPARIRGGLVMLQQLAISVRHPAVVRRSTSRSTRAGWGWRPMFAARGAARGLALAIGMLFMSYSPRWLGMHDRWDEAAEVLGPHRPGAQGGRARAAAPGRRGHRGHDPGASCSAPGLRGALIAGVGLAVFQQFVGPNTVLFYDADDLRLRGDERDPAAASDDLRGGDAVRVRAPDDRVRRRGRPQEAVLPGPGRDGFACSCCSASRSTWARRAGARARGPDHPAGLRRRVTRCRSRRCSRAWRCGRQEA